MKDSIDPAKQRNEDTAFRNRLRRERIIAREALPADEHARRSALVLDHLAGLISTREPLLLGFYWPIRAEVDCRPLVSTLLARGWRACLPHISDRNQAMRFREWTPKTKMVEGEYGIPTVEAGPFVEPDLLLIPVNVFDTRGFRLGYGGGYYDRTISALPKWPDLIGIGFDLARVDSIRPQVSDIPMKAVATELCAEVYSK